MMKEQRHLRPFCPKSKEEPMIEPQPVLPIDTHSLQPAPGAHVQQALITTDQYESSTYQQWFERQTGLSVDEAIALSLARQIAS